MKLSITRLLNELSKLQGTGFNVNNVNTTINNNSAILMMIFNKGGIYKYMFKVTWINYGELDNTSNNFCSLTYDVSNHRVFYETCNSIRHCLRCDFGSIFDKLHSIVSLEEFQEEIPCEDGCDGDWYKFEYTLNGKEVHYEGYIYGLKLHKEVVSLIESCAKDTLEDEKKFLQNKCTDHHDYLLWLKKDWVQDIIKKRQELEEDFLDWWIDIETKSSEDIFYNPNGAACITTFEEDKDKLYSASELSYLLESLSDEDREKINDCQFKLVEQYPDDDSGDVYDYLTVYRNNNEIGKIDMQLHSNTYFDLIDMEIKSTDTIPYYTYEMTLYGDSKDEGKDIKSHFDDSKFRCKKCGKIFCTCGGFFNRKG